MAAFIPDGFTDSFYLDGIERLYPAVRGRFRPCTHEETGEYFAASRSLKPREQDRKAAQLVAQRIVDWNIVDPAGEPVAVAAENVLRLNRVLFSRLLAVVTGVEAPDEDPTATDTERRELLVDKEEADKSKLPFRSGT